MRFYILSCGKYYRIYFLFSHDNKWPQVENYAKQKTLTTRDLFPGKLRQCKNVNIRFYSVYAHVIPGIIKSQALFKTIMNLPVQVYYYSYLFSVSCLVWCIIDSVFALLLRIFLHLTVYTITLFTSFDPTYSVWQVILFQETGVVHRITILTIYFYFFIY